MLCGASAHDPRSNEADSIKLFSEAERIERLSRLTLYTQMGHSKLHNEHARRDSASHLVDQLAIKRR